MARTIFTLSDFDQSTSPRNMRPGSLTVSQNTRTTKTGARRKRKGFARSAVATYTFPVAADDTVTDPSATMQELSPDGQMFRDASENIWARDPAGTTAYFRGEHRRCGVTSRDAGFPAHKTIKPCSISVGTNTWTFALSTTETGSTPTADPAYDSFYYLVEDSSGNVLKGPTRIADGTVDSVANYCVVYHPGQSKIYLFKVYRNANIQVCDINVSTYAVSANTTYDTGASAKWNCIDAVYDTTAAKVHVAYTSWNEALAPGGNVCWVRHSSLNTATSTATSATNELAGDQGVTGIYLCGGVSYLQGQPFTDNEVRYTYWVKGSSTQDANHVVHTIVNATTLAVTDSRIMQSLNATRYTLEHAGVTSGFYVAASDTSYIFAELMYPAVGDEETSNPTGAGNDFNALTYWITFNNTSLAIVNSTPGQGLLGSWLASKPFQGADSKWYILTGIDSGTNGYQRAFHVRRADISVNRVCPDTCRIVAQINWPDASFRAYRWRGQVSASPLAINNSWGWAPTQATFSGGARLALGRSGDTPLAHVISVVTVDFGAAFSRGVKLYDDLTLYPGGIPVVAGPRTPAHDLTPIIFPVQPPRLTAAGSSGALGAVLVTSSFRFRDPTGRITRSTSYPDPASMTFNSGGSRTMAVRNCSHVGHGDVEIEVWSTVPGGTTLHLQFVLPNTASSSETSVLVDPANFRDDTEQLPISATGALAQNPPPPCRVAAVFAERVVLTGTPVEGEFLYSQPFEGGLGPEFNIEALAQVWTGRGPINAASPVDLNTLAFFRQDQIAAIQGPGPAGTGGAYSQILELNTQHGLKLSTTRGHAVVRTPMGVIFQDYASGRLCIVLPGLRVEEMPPAIQDSVELLRLVGGGHMGSEETVWILTDFNAFSGSMWAIDLREPEQTKASRWGNWHFWTSTAITESVPVGLAELNGAPLWLQANGSWRSYKTSGQLFQDTTAASAQADVLMTLTTGKLAPDGAHGEVIVNDLQVIGTHLSASSVRFTTTNDAGTAEDHDVTIATPFNYSWRPGNLLRDQEFTLSIAEQAGSTGEGFELDSVAVDYEPANRLKRLNTAKVI